MPRFVCLFLTVVLLLPGAAWPGESFGPGKTDNIFRNLRDDGKVIVTAPIHLSFPRTDLLKPFNTLLGITPPAGQEENKAFFGLSERASGNDIFGVVPMAVTAMLLFKNDGAIRDHIQAQRTPQLDDAARFFDTFGDGRFALLLGGGLWLLGGDKGEAVGRQTVEAFLEAGAANGVIKVVAGRARPSQSPDDPYHLTGFSLNDRSFPSGHTAVAFTLATVAGKEYHVPVLAYGIATLTGLARIEQDAHWSTDVLVGAIVGTLVGNLNYVDYDKNSVNGRVFYGSADGLPGLTYVKRF